MAEPTREPGWYPDPWGTEHERYFDGSAWARQTRPLGSSDEPGAMDLPAPAGGAGSTAIVSGPPAASSAAPSELAPESPTGMPDGATAAPGWHPDPWGIASLRWWDGTGWTGHVSGPPVIAAPVTIDVDVAAQRSLARWLQPLLIVAGVVQAAGMFSSAVQAKWFVAHWDELTQPGGAANLDAPNGGPLAGLVFPVGIAVGVLFLMWFYRAARTGWASGLPARRSPLLATFSFIIPIVNFWWPYQSAMDMIPADDPTRGLVQRWWILWLTATLCGLLIFPAQAIYDSTAARIVATIGAVAVILASLAAFAMVGSITRIHEARLHAARDAV